VDLGGSEGVALENKMVGGSEKRPEIVVKDVLEGSGQSAGLAKFLRWKSKCRDESTVNRFSE